MTTLRLSAITGAVVTAPPASPTLNKLVEQGTIEVYKVNITKGVELLSMYALVHEAVSGGKFRLGIYTDIEANQDNPICPKTLMIESEDLSAESVGSKSVVWSTPRPELPAGEYWFAIWAKEGSIKFRGLSGAAMPILGGGAGTAQGINHFIVPYIETENGVNMPGDLQDAFINGYTSGSSTVVHMGLYKYYIAS
jgi:hypothetical protein